MTIAERLRAVALELGAIADALDTETKLESGATCSVREAADILGVDRRRVNQLIAKDPTLVASRSGHGHGRWRLDVERVRELKAKRPERHSDPESTLITDVETAQLLGMSLSALRSWRYAKKGPQFVKLGSTIRAAVRYRRSDVEAFIASHEATNLE